MKFLPKLTFVTFMGCAVSAAMANSVTLMNGTPNAGAMTVVYKIAHKNKGQPAQLGATQTLQLSGTTAIPISLDGYTYAGIVPISVNGHMLPGNVNQFAQSQQCSVATDANHPTGQMVLTAQMNPLNHPKSLSCAVHNSVAE